MGDKEHRRGTRMRDTDEGYGLETQIRPCMY